MPRPCEAHTGPSGGEGGSLQASQARCGVGMACCSLTQGGPVPDRPHPSSCCSSNPRQTGQTGTAVEAKPPDEHRGRAGQNWRSEGFGNSVFQLPSPRQLLHPEAHNPTPRLVRGALRATYTSGPWHRAQGQAGEPGSRVSGTSLHPPGRQSGRPRQGGRRLSRLGLGQGSDHLAPGTARC